MRQLAKREPFWLDFGDGVRVLFAPIDRVLRRRANSAAMARCAECSSEPPLSVFALTLITGTATRRSISEPPQPSLRGSSARLYGFADGTGAAARFAFGGRFDGLAIDRTGNVYLADTYNYAVRKLTPNGTVTTFAGAANQPGQADGTSAAARFSSPGGVALDRVVKGGVEEPPCDGGVLLRGCDVVAAGIGDGHGGNGEQRECACYANADAEAESSYPGIHRSVLTVAQECADGIEFRRFRYL